MIYYFKITGTQKGSAEKIELFEYDMISEANTLLQEQKYIPQEIKLLTKEAAYTMETV